MHKIITLIQARTGSTRLPNKVMMPLEGEPLLGRMLKRVSRSKFKGEIVVITSTDESDKVIVEFCLKKAIKCFCGHPTDLLDRHYQAAKSYKADVVLKIPSDCPLIDPDIIDRAIHFFLDNKFDFVSNLHPASYPDGNDVEIMSFSSLERAWKNAKRPLEREHTTPYLWENPDLFKIGNVLWESGLDYSKTHRFTIDYNEDYNFIKKIYEALYPTNPHFGLHDILELLNQRQDIYDINSKYAGEYWYKNHVGELKTITEY